MPPHTYDFTERPSEIPPKADGPVCFDIFRRVRIIIGDSYRPPEFSRRVLMPPTRRAISRDFPVAKYATCHSSSHFANLPPQAIQLQPVDSSFFVGTRRCYPRVSASGDLSGFFRIFQTVALFLNILNARAES